MLLCFCFVHAMNVQAIMSSDLDEVYPQQVIALNHLYWYDVGALFSLNPKYAHEMEMNWGATPGRQGLLYRIMFEPHRWVNDEVESFLTLHSGEYQSFHDHSFAICICCACVTSAHSLLSSAFVRAMQLSFTSASARDGGFVGSHIRMHHFQIPTTPQTMRTYWGCTLRAAESLALKHSAQQGPRIFLATNDRRAVLSIESTSGLAAGSGDVRHTALMKAILPEYEPVTTCAKVNLLFISFCHMTQYFTIFNAFFNDIFFVRSVASLKCRTTLFWKWFFFHAVRKCMSGRCRRSQSWRGTSATCSRHTLLMRSVSRYRRQQLRRLISASTFRYKKMFSDANSLRCD